MQITWGGEKKREKERGAGSRCGVLIPVSVIRYLHLYTFFSFNKRRPGFSVTFMDSLFQKKWCHQCNCMQKKAAQRLPLFASCPGSLAAPPSWCTAGSAWGPPDRRHPNTRGTDNALTAPYFQHPLVLGPPGLPGDCHQSQLRIPEAFIFVFSAKSGTT